MYRIIGTDMRYGMKSCYGEFETLKEAIYHLNELKRGTLGRLIKFGLVEIHND